MIGICSKCGLEGKIDTHHIDQDRYHNEAGNLVELCRWCHKEAHRQLGRQPSGLGLDEIRRQYEASFPRA